MVGSKDSKQIMIGSKAVKSKQSMCIIKISVGIHFRNLGHLTYFLYWMDFSINYFLKFPIHILFMLICNTLIETFF